MGDNIAIKHANASAYVYCIQLFRPSFVSFSKCVCVCVWGGGGGGGGGGRERGG